MEQFRLLNRTRQVTEYSCGASALQSVLSYWGRDVDETELMELLHTTPEVGTYPLFAARTPWASRRRPGRISRWKRWSNSLQMAIP
jgi:hypothetical protein